MNDHSNDSVAPETGLVQAYINPFRGRNHAPLGLMFRASGYGMRSLIVPFDMHEPDEARLRFCRRYVPYLKVIPKAQGFEKTFEEARNAVFSGNFDLVILEGILGPEEPCGVYLDNILGLIHHRPEHVELVLTGPHDPHDVVQAAHLVTEVSRLPSDRGGTLNSVEVVTGKGKGKTTHCLGKALMMISMGIDTHMVQIIKSPKPYGEVMAAERLRQLTIETMGMGFVNKENPNADPDHELAAKKAWHRGRDVVLSGRYGLVILDEINIAVNYGFISPEAVLQLLREKPENVHVMLSGRYAHSDLMRAADTVIYMKEIKHPYKTGIGARKGIEY